MTAQTFYDIDAKSKAVLREWNVGVGTADEFRFDDREVVAALSVAAGALDELAFAIRRAQARYQIEKAREVIASAEAILTEVPEP